MPSFVKYSLRSFPSSLKPAFSYTFCAETLLTSVIRYIFFKPKLSNPYLQSSLVAIVPIPFDC